MKKIAKKRFTLVELIVVVAVLAVLWTVAFMSFSWINSKADVVATKTTISEFWKSLSLYEVANWSFPQAVDENWNRVANWTRWFLSSNNSMIMNWTSVDENWTFTIKGRKIFYTVDPTWKYYAVWIEASYTWPVAFINHFVNSANADWGTIAIVDTDYAVDSSKYTLLWITNWEVNPTYQEWTQIDWWFVASLEWNDLYVFPSNWDASTLWDVTIDWVDYSITRVVANWAFTAWIIENVPSIWVDSIVSVAWLNWWADIFLWKTTQEQASELSFLASRSNAFTDESCFTMVWWKITWFDEATCWASINIPWTINWNVVTEIWDTALISKWLTEIIIPSTVTKIWYSAFRLNELTHVTIPAWVTTIKSWAFASNNIESVVLPSWLTAIEDSRFKDNSLSSITIPEWVTSIWSYAFEGNNIVTLSLPDTLLTIKDKAFRYNELESIILPDSVTDVYSRAFQENKITTVDLWNVVTIWSSAFFHNRITDLVMPNTITSIWSWAFSNNYIENIVFSNSLTTIWQRAFQTNNIASLVIPSWMLDISDYAFRWNKISNLTLPSTITNIWIDAFTLKRGSWVDIGTTILNWPASWYVKTHYDDTPGFSYYFANYVGS